MNCIHILKKAHNYSRNFENYNTDNYYLFSFMIKITILFSAMQNLQVSNIEQLEKQGELFQMLMDKTFQSEI